jgi:hypothetical protein
MPATRLWVEWCVEPWQAALQSYGFPFVEVASRWIGRRGALVTGSIDGRRGLVRTFWTTGHTDRDVFASSIESYFDFDTPEGEAPTAPDRHESFKTIQVRDEAREGGDDALSRCFRFRYERSWSEYYGSARLSEAQREALWRHALGTIALDIPMLLAFILLLSTRNGLPQRPSDHRRLNTVRTKSGKVPLLDYVHVRAPLLPAYFEQNRAEPRSVRRSPRLHHVRGHLVRRGGQLFWRVPHLRGSARSGAVQTRTVVWTFERTETLRAT